MKAARASEIAGELHAQRVGRRAVSPVHKDLTAGGLPTAYEAQDCLFRLLHPGKRPVGGYKIGMGGGAIRTAYGLDEPSSGAIGRDELLASGATVRADAYLHLAVECEIAVRMGEAFPDGEGSMLALLESIDAVCAAFELVDDRHLDYANIDVFTMVADNGWNAGLVLGPVSTDTRVIGTALEGRLQINGHESFRGINTDTLLPLDATAWLAGHLAARGRRLEAGQWITTGGLTSCFPKSGDELIFSAGTLEPVTLKVA